MFQYFWSQSNGEKLSPDKAKLTGFSGRTRALLFGFFKFEYLLPEFSRKWVPVNVSLQVPGKAVLKFFDDYIIPFLAKQLLFVAFL